VDTQADSDTTDELKRYNTYCEYFKPSVIPAGGTVVLLGSLCFYNWQCCNSPKEANQKGSSTRTHHTRTYLIFTIDLCAGIDQIVQASDIVILCSHL
jgi:hypothetical protein